MGSVALRWGAPVTFCQSVEAFRRPEARKLRSRNFVLPPFSGACPGTAPVTCYQLPSPILMPRMQNRIKTRLAQSQKLPKLYPPRVIDGFRFRQWLGQRLLTTMSCIALMTAEVGIFKRHSIRVGEPSSASSTDKVEIFPWQALFVLGLDLPCREFCS